MNNQTLKISSFFKSFGLFAVFLLVLFGVVMFSATSNAKEASLTNVPEACRKYTTASAAAFKLELCLAAYNASYEAGTVAAAKCDDKATAELKAACLTGARAGKAAKLKDARDEELDKIRQTGIDGAEAGTSKEESCKKYKVDANKTACEKAWEKRADELAKEQGEKAGSADECDGILGGASAEKACKDAFKKAKAKKATTGKNDCAGVNTYFDFGCSGKDTDKGGNDNPIIALLLTALSWITGLVALATVGGIIYGGILYTSAQDNSAQTQKGIMYVVNSVLGLMLWFSAYILINFIVPGGLFN